MWTLSAACILAVIINLTAATEWRSFYGKNYQNSSKQIQLFQAQGFLPTWLSGYALGSKVQFAGIFTENQQHRKWKVYLKASLIGLEEQVKDLKREGFTPIQISAYTVGESPSFALIWIWNPKAPMWILKWELTALELEDQMNKNAANGYRVMSISPYRSKAAPRHACIWVKSAWKASTQVVRYGLTRSGLDKILSDNIRHGFIPKSIQGCRILGETYYTVMMEKQRDASHQVIRQIDVTDSHLMDDSIFKFSMGYHLSSISGYVKYGRVLYAAVWTKEWLAHPTHDTKIKVAELNKVSYDGELSKLISKADQERIYRQVVRFMDRFDIPGVSLAVGKDEKLIYANGFGYADIDGNEKVNPGHLFRIASISKPITAVAVLKLIDENRLRFDDFILGPNGTLNRTVSLAAELSRNEKAVKVEHLLRHTSGNWENYNDDPMFQMEHLDNAALLKWILDNRDVRNVPGTKFGYSNFGYFLLGRVIEQVTGKTYEEYVKEQIFNPMGISNAFIGKSTREEKRPNEVTYYRQRTSGDHPYEVNVPRLDSSVGWLMTPINLLKFLAHVDKLSSVQDILPPELMTNMTTATPADETYGMGWFLDKNGTNWYHGGAMPGARALLKKIGTKCAAIAMNCEVT